MNLIFEVRENFDFVEGEQSIWTILHLAAVYDHVDRGWCVINVLQYWQTALLFGSLLRDLSSLYNDTQFAVKISGKVQIKYNASLLQDL